MQEGIISGFCDNNYISLVFDVPGVPAGSLMSTGLLTIKLTETAPDSAIVISKTITTTNVPGTGHIVDDGASGIGEIRFDLPAVDTGLLIPDVQYRYWVDIVLDSGEPSTLERGIIFSKQGSDHA